MKPMNLMRRCTLLAPLALGLGLALPAPAAKAAACEVWPQWSGFKQRFLEPGGRVVDRGSAESITTSEAQSYGLFFALVANDREAFDRILRWTEDNLAGGDLSARLPAWKWGRRSNDSWGVLDENAASDADLWIAYALAEAGRLWKQQKYSALGQLLAERALREETALLPGLGRTLLPGPRGFQSGAGISRLNPSYVPLQLMRRFAALYPQPEWRQLVTTSIDLIVRSSPRGFAPDWVVWKAGSGFQPDHETEAVGSFNAIRVYLWAGMLPADDPARAVLLKTLAPAAQAVAKSGTPPLEVHTRNAAPSGVGGAGFSAAMLPFLQASGMQDAARQQRLRVEARAPLERQDNYYEQVLTLFALGFADGHYRFAKDGALTARWTCASS